MGWTYYPRPLSLHEAFDSLLNLAEAKTRMGQRNIWHYRKHLWKPYMDGTAQLDRHSLLEAIPPLLDMAEHTRGQKEYRFYKENIERIKRIRQTLRRERLRFWK